jgi:site-specific DNA recombinase
MSVPDVQKDPGLRVALYARVSSDQQAQSGTVQSQVDAILQRAAQDQVGIEPELRFVDEGHSGATLARPALERLRDVAAAGGIDRLYVLCPDRLARNYVYQMLLVQELAQCAVELVFLDHPMGESPEDHLLLQMQGMIGEYERAKILERSRRGKLHAAQHGRISVMGSAPYGYRYVPAVKGGSAAGYNVHLAEAQVIGQIFQWAAVERVTLRETCLRLEKQQVLSPSGLNRWSFSTVRSILSNPAYKGSAAWGKTCRGPLRPRPRPIRNSTGIPRGGKSICHAPPEKWINIAVPAIVDEATFNLVAEQMAENRRRVRQRRTGPLHLLQGLLVCKQCGYAYYAGGGPRHTYYLCTGSQPYRWGGKRICPNSSIREDQLDQAVWNDVRAMLSEPSRIEHELRRRTEGDEPDLQRQAMRRLEGQIEKVRRSIVRLIDAYEEGLLNKSEFEPRLVAARRHLSQLQEQLKQQQDHDALRREMKLVIDNFDTFAKSVQRGLDNADFSTKRQIIQTLVKRVEMDLKQVNIVYRVNLSPFDPSPDRGVLQHCARRVVRLLRKLRSRNFV